MQLTKNIVFTAVLVTFLAHSFSAYAYSFDLFKKSAITLGMTVAHGITFAGTVTKAAYQELRYGNYQSIKPGHVYDLDAHMWISVDSIGQLTHAGWYWQEGHEGPEGTGRWFYYNTKEITRSHYAPVADKPEAVL